MRGSPSMTSHSQEPEMDVVTKALTQKAWHETKRNYM